MGMKKEGIGLFVVGGLVLLVIGMFLIGDRHQLFARHAGPTPSSRISRG